MSIFGESTMAIKMKFVVFAMLTAMFHGCSIVFAQWAIHMFHLMHYLSAFLRDGANLGTWVTAMIAAYKFCFPKTSIRSMWWWFWAKAKLFIPSRRNAFKITLVMFLMVSGYIIYYLIKR
jgi:hypothetical protein